MPDDVDRMQELNLLENEAIARNHRREIPKGEPGDCKECGEYSKRLVVGRCAPCRDALQDPRRR